MDVKKWAQKIFTQAYRYRSSDIHILPEDSHYGIHLRVGQGMTRAFQLSKRDGERLISYLKFLGNMDVGERRRPQSGAATFLIEGEERNIRLSTMTNFRTEESLVVRLMTQSQDFDLSQHAYFKQQVATMEQLTKHHSGLILFSGPVSSGKTTTMYHLIREEAQSQQKQVITIEDPVEIEEENFLQIQVNEKADITYDVLLKQSLRHHPDILIVGEIRDEETAAAVIRGALTGHLILASVHAKNAEGVLSRLEELGVSRVMLEQTLIGIVFQKMLPRYCPLCQGTCELYCTHLAPNQKKSVLYDVRADEAIRRLLKEEGDRCLNFNTWLRKVYAYGYITEETYVNFAVPETTAHGTADKVSPYAG